MSSDAVIPVQPAAAKDSSFAVGCLAGWMGAAVLMYAVWVVVLKL